MRISTALSATPVVVTSGVIVLLATLVFAQDGTGDDPGTSLRGSGTISDAQSSAETEQGIKSCAPNVQVSRLGLLSSTEEDDFAYYGAADGIRAFSAASTSCNVGCGVAEWFSGDSGRHPVIAQNVYRLKDDRFEQIGMSWLKHSFCAVSEPTCGSCSATPCPTLGVGCADTYWATLNGSHNYMGPRTHITNVWPSETVATVSHVGPTTGPLGDPTIGGRAQVRETDIEAGGRNFWEVHYLTHDEPYDMRYDNASWREVNLGMTGVDTIGIPDGQGQASVHREPAIYAWQAISGADITRVNAPNDGAFFVGSLVVPEGDGTWRYEYAVFNMNSQRAARRVSVSADEAATVLDNHFSAPFYHSGEAIDSTPWALTETAGWIHWTTDGYVDNLDANAIRWSTLYSYSITSDAPPTDGTMEIELFRPPLGETVSVPVPTPGPRRGTPCPADTNNDGEVNVTDLVNVVLDWGTDGSANGGDVNGSGLVDVTDLVEVVLAWGTC